MRTIVGSFDDPQVAQTAVDQLVAQGFSSDRVHLQTAPATRDRSMDSEPNTGVLAGMGHFFSNLFESDEKTRADREAQALRGGSTMVAVDTLSDTDVDKAQAILNQLSSTTLAARAEQLRTQGWTNGQLQEWARDEEAFRAESEPVQEAIPVLAEQAAVRKRAVDIGGLRVVKRLSETPVSEVVTLRQEHVLIERHPVDRPATEADFANFKPGTFEVREMAEEAVISKVARVVEEVSVVKEVTHHSETVTDVVRRTDVEAEPLPASDHPTRA